MTTAGQELRPAAAHARKAVPSRSSIRNAAVFSRSVAVGGLGLAIFFYAPAIWQDRFCRLILLAMPAALALFVAIVHPEFSGFFALSHHMAAGPGKCVSRRRSMAKSLLRLCLNPEKRCRRTAILTVGPAVRR